MKIAYLCDISPHEAWSYSSGNARIFNALKSQGAELEIIDNNWHHLEIIRKMIHKMPVSINWRLRWRLHLLFSRIISKTVTAELEKSRYDALFCPYSFQSLASIRLPYPMLRVFTSDATPTAYKRSEIGASFGSFLSISRLLDPAILRAETRIFRANDLNIWPSEWQKEQADRIYGLSDDQSHVIPWGANISVPDLDFSGPPAPSKGNVRMLLVGRDWFAKGGPLVFETLQKLRANGINAHLTVIGCTPPEFHCSEDMTIFPSLDKTKKDEMAQFEKQYRNAHFLVMPSFESYGFAFCEASAYGLPSIGLRVGGVPIAEGINGHALPANSGPQNFSDCITSYLGRANKYKALRVSSRQYFEATLNWGAWGRSTIDPMKSRLSDL